MLFIITFITFFLSFISPSDPAEILLSKRGAPPSNEVLEKTRKEMGLDKPISVQYMNWAKGVLKGDLGKSFRTGKDIQYELNQALPKTVKLSAMTMVIIVVSAIPIGILCTMKQDGAFDRCIQMVTYFFVSLPSFVIGLCLLYIFSVKLNISKVSASDDLKGYFMPAMVLVINLGSHYVRQVRSIFLDEYSKDYVIALRSRGLSEMAILFQHVLLNSLVPIITLVGTSFAELLAGTTIVENIFSIHGLGYLAIKSVSNRDYPMVQGIVLWMAIIFVLINILIDLSYRIIDPRIKLGKEVGEK